MSANSPWGWARWTRRFLERAAGGPGISFRVEPASLLYGLPSKPLAQGERPIG